MTHAQAKSRHAALVADIRNYDRAYDEGRPLVYDQLDTSIVLEMKSHGIEFHTA